MPRFMSLYVYRSHLEAAAEWGAAALCSTIMQLLDVKAVRRSR